MGSLDMSYSLVFPNDLDEYEWEVVSKGWFADVRLVHLGKQYVLNFYDPVRLSQEVESALHDNGIFVEENLIVIETITRENMVKAVELMAQSKSWIRLLVPE